MTRPTIIAGASLWIALLFSTGCSTHHASTATPLVSATPASTRSDCVQCKIVSFKHDVMPALRESCLACHYDKSQSPGLDLSTDVAYQDLVNGKSRLNPKQVLVKPSSVAESFLVDKLGPTPHFGSHMPPYGRPLTPEETSLLKEWIAQGAKNN